MVGLSWGSDDTIVFATETATGLMRISAVGGEAEVFTTVQRDRGELDHGGRRCPDRPVA